MAVGKQFLGAIPPLSQLKWIRTDVTLIPAYMFFLLSPAFPKIPIHLILGGGEIQMYMGVTSRMIAEVALNLFG